MRDLPNFASFIFGDDVNIADFDTKAVDKL